MNQDDFIIHVYCRVCECYDQVVSGLPQRLRRGGVAPDLSDCEVITLEVCGELLKMNTDKDLFNHFKTHYQDWFPHLRERSRFVRQAADLWQVKAQIQRRLVEHSGAHRDAVQSIDTLPVSVCANQRRLVDRCFKGQADSGYCAAKKLYFYGFKLGLRIARWGLITHYELLDARAHDITHFEVLLEGLYAPLDQQWLVPADKGFIDKQRAASARQRRGLAVITPPRQGTKRQMHSEHPKALLRACSHWRKLIETVNAHLTERFAVNRIRVHDLWHFQHRLIRKILAHTVAVCLNLQMGRKPLDLDGLIAP